MTMTTTRPDFDRHLPDPADVRPPTEDDLHDLELAIDDALDIDLPDGMEVGCVQLILDPDGFMTGAVVRLLALHDHVPLAAWAEVEEAVDLTPLGFEFRDSGGLGGPFHERGRTYAGGTYQTWSKR